MDLYARVNIMAGRAVRLPRGNLAEAIFLDADPAERARGWIAKGADRLHVVDLDAAAHGDYRNRPLVSDMIAAVEVPVQVAGGVRSPKEVEILLDAGAWRVVMGTAAIENQIMVWEICRDHPDKIVVSLDVHPDEELATRGWTENSGRYLEEVLIEMSSAGVAAFAVAEVGRDALAEPPNLEALNRALATVDEPVLAAGGVRNLEDLSDLAQLEADGKTLAGVIVGREVTAGRFSLEDAAMLLSGSDSTTASWSAHDLEAAVSRYEQALRSEGGSEERVSGAVARAAEFVSWLNRKGDDEPE